MAWMTARKRPVREDCHGRAQSAGAQALRAGYVVRDNDALMSDNVMSVIESELKPHGGRY